MISRTTLKYITPFLLFFLFLIDAHVTRIIAAWTDNIYVANAHLALLVLFIVSRVVNERFLLGTSLVLDRKSTRLNSSHSSKSRMPSSA